VRVPDTFEHGEQPDGAAAERAAVSDLQQPDGVHHAVSEELLSALQSVSRMTSSASETKTSSVLLFAGAPLLVYAALSASWLEFVGLPTRGPIRFEMCGVRDCQTFTILKLGGVMGFNGIIGILVFLCCIGAAVLAVLAGVAQLRRG